MVKFIDTESRVVVGRGGGLEGWGYGFMRTVSVWEDERLLEMDGGMAARRERTSYR